MSGCLALCMSGCLALWLKKKTKKQKKTLTGKCCFVFFRGGLEKQNRLEKKKHGASHVFFGFLVFFR